MEQLTRNSRGVWSKAGGEADAAWDSRANTDKQKRRKNLFAKVAELRAQCELISKRMANFAVARAHALQQHNLLMDPHIAALELFDMRCAEEESRHANSIFAKERVRRARVVDRYRASWAPTGNLLIDFSASLSPGRFPSSASLPDIGLRGSSRAFSVTGGFSGSFPDRPFGEGDSAPPSRAVSLQLVIPPLTISASSVPVYAPPAPLVPPPPPLGLKVRRLDGRCLRGTDLRAILTRMGRSHTEFHFQVVLLKKTHALHKAHCCFYLLFVFFS